MQRRLFGCSMREHITASASIRAWRSIRAVTQSYSSGDALSQVATGVQNLTVPPDTDRGNYTHFLIYTRSRRFAAINCADPLGTGQVHV